MFSVPERWKIQIRATFEYPSSGTLNWTAYFTDTHTPIPPRAFLSSGLSFKTPLERRPGKFKKLKRLSDKLMVCFVIQIFPVFSREEFWQKDLMIKTFSSVWGWFIWDEIVLSRSSDDRNKKRDFFPSSQLVPLSKEPIYFAGLARHGGGYRNLITCFAFLHSRIIYRWQCETVCAPNLIHFREEGRTSY